MLIYYHKDTKQIVGHAGGRTHSEEELKMWIGDPKEIKRIEIFWKPVRWYDKEEHLIPDDCLDACDENGELLVDHAEYEPDCDKDMKKIIEEVEKDPMALHSKYKVSDDGKKLKQKDVKELNEAAAERKKAQAAQKEKENRTKELLELVGNKQKPLEERFNGLVELLDLRFKAE